MSRRSSVDFITSGITFEDGLCIWSMCQGLASSKTSWYLPWTQSCSAAGVCPSRNSLLIPTFSRWGLNQGSLLALPPVDLVGIKKGLNIAACVFRIVVLVKYVAVWVSLLNEWDQGGRQNVSIPCSGQRSLEHHQSGSSSLGNAGPYMNSRRVLVLKLPWCIFLAKVLSSVRLQLYCTFIREYDILKLLLIFQALVHPYCSLFFVGISNSLTIPCTCR